MVRRIIKGRVISIKHSSIAKICFMSGCFNSKVKKHITHKSFVRARFASNQDVRVGDMVLVQEVPPISKTLFWHVV
ncbi:putative Small ribosomal subunit protein uS17 [Candidatus Xenohaliotis californiensis]|uniref:30S ribosomal protein S17 n=1 Tax=Candidatus Xenohaliotis californiensis TaxID=84677 RepID=A0ABM9N8N1_9RICK|nr:putative Small ribosomal subunit protein uS17 [Candidatus Xenohaliotis californiensis]